MRSHPEATALLVTQTEVIFEDFDEAEMMEVWTKMRAERGWLEADPRLADVVVRRLSKASGSKGFGNARSVRVKLDEATACAMSRPDFDTGAMMLQIEDVRYRPSNSGLNHIEHMK